MISHSPLFLVAGRVSECPRREMGMRARTGAGQGLVGGLGAHSRLLRRAPDEGPFLLLRHVGEYSTKMSEWRFSMYNRHSQMMLV
jgi:hypothetical protein